jgi:peptidoglycan hydrolase-like protein with peptidoglycan-binding domain
VRRALAVSLPLVAVGAAAAGIVLAGGADQPRARATSSAGPTAAVARRTLTDEQRADGTLGYRDERKVANRLTGTVTWLAPKGSIVRLGGRLFEVDGEPVILLDGRIPAYRPMRTGMPDGDDVLQLEGNLVALGYSPGIVDDHYSTDTAAAVKLWQDAWGLEKTGSIELGRVVNLPGARRISGHEAAVGDAAGPGPVLKTTSNQRVVTVNLAAADQQIARNGAHVEIELPDGDVVPGRISHIGSVAEQPAGEDPNGGGGGPTVTVTIRLTGKRRGGRLDQAPVSVSLVRDRRDKVLTVPVTALVARRGGVYALDVVNRGLVEVTPGLFANGLVEIEGRGITEGTRVRVPEQ